MLNLLLFLLIFIFSNTFFYILSVKIRALFINKEKLEEQQLEFNNSFFLISLPTNDYKLYTSLPKDFKILYDFEGFLFPKLQGIKVYYKKSSDKKFIFYAKLSDISLKNSKISSKNLITILLFNKEQKNSIKQKICKKLRERNIEL